MSIQVLSRCPLAVAVLAPAGAHQAQVDGGEKGGGEDAGGDEEMGGEAGRGPQLGVVALGAARGRRGRSGMPSCGREAGSMVGGDAMLTYPRVGLVEPADTLIPYSILRNSACPEYIHTPYINHARIAPDARVIMTAHPIHHLLPSIYFAPTNE